MANDQREVRLQKLEALRTAGIRPYADRYPTSHSLDAARKEAETTEGTKVRVAGRVMTARAFGQLTFVHLQDASGRCQVALDASVVGADALARFDKLVDLGDFVGIEGTTWKTKKGEPTVRATGWTFLAKALRPLPEKWHGLSDRETCYRERHLDLLVNPETRARFKLRSRLVRELRAYLDAHGFEEVETPVLAAKATGALARPFLTHHNALNIQCALRIAPETWLKKCVAGGIDRVYEVARCFRNEGMDPSHLQDFTMCEWYAAYWDFRDNMDFTQGLILHLIDHAVGSRRIRWGANEIDFTPPWPRVSLRDLVLKDSGIDYDACPDAASLRAAIARKGIRLDRDDLDQLGRGNLIDVLYKKVSRPKLVSPVFVTGHPLDLSPLARRNDDVPSVVDRFQLVVNTWEIVNAYSELVDPVDQRGRFEQQMSARAAGDDEAMEIDEDYLACMEHGMPPMSGWGMGIDRFVCLVTGQENLRDAVLFPLMRPLDASPASSAAPAAPAAPAVQGAVGGTGREARAGGEAATSEVKPEFASLLGHPVDDVADAGIPWTRARALFDEWVTTPSLRRQMEQASAVMGALARRLGRNEDAWRVIGLLHNLDYDRVKDPAQHCLVAAATLKAEGMHPGAIHAIAAHNDDGLAHTGIRCVSVLDHAVSCAEAVVGLVHATAQVLPSKDVKDVKASSVVKRYKDPKFAPTIERPLIARCQGLGLSLDDFLALATAAVQGMPTA
ncbi:MAG: lysine--tRNA ligase [Planctomycetia bacterium]|nr:lysine--tRNA ligase [Planctomycetia bacterium]